MLTRIKKASQPRHWRNGVKAARRAGRDVARGLRTSAPAKLYARAMEAVREARLRVTVEHVWGPQTAEAAADQATVVCLMRDGEPYLRSFVQHYTAMGVQQIVLLDNGSRDRSLELARAYDNVTLLRSPLPYRQYQFPFKRHLLKQYGRGGWRLLVDIDELFDYPASDRLPLPGLLAYLNAGGYTAVVAYLLDMFGAGGLSELKSSPEDDLRALYPYYDISNIHTRPYKEHYGEANRVSNEAVQLYWGGIRNTVFGSQDWLTKHPLLRVEGGLALRGNVSHDAYAARIADISTVLYHYKLFDQFAVQVERAVREGSYWGGSRQYQRYKAVLDAQPDLQICGPASRRLGQVDELVAQGFLAVSPAYEEWVARRGAPRVS